MTWSTEVISDDGQCQARCPKVSIEVDLDNSYIVFIYRDKYSTFPRNCIQWLNSCILTAMRIQPVFSWS